jgi:hypothetical protein
MPTAASHEVTQLLMAWNDGDQAALERLIPLVHAELHRIARRHMRNERAGHTFQTSALIKEAYLRLIDAQQVRWQNRAPFLRIAAQTDAPGSGRLCSQPAIRSRRPRIPGIA